MEKQGKASQITEALKQASRETRETLKQFLVAVREHENGILSDEELFKALVECRKDSGARRIMPTLIKLFYE